MFSVMQALYDYTHVDAMAQPATDTRARVDGTSGTLTELHVEGFDAEQIWLQLDMASAQLVRRARRLLKKAGTDPALLTPEREQDLTGQSLLLFLVSCAYCLCIATKLSNRQKSQASRLGTFLCSCNRGSLLFCCYFGDMLVYPCFMHLCGQHLQSTVCAITHLC